MGFSISACHLEVDDPHVRSSTPVFLQSLKREDEIVRAFPVHDGETGSLCHGAGKQAVDKLGLARPCRTGQHTVHGHVVTRDPDLLMTDFIPAK